MTKSGAQPMGSSWSPVKGWTADTIGYPGSTVSGDGLRVQSSKIGAVVTAVLPFSGGSGGFNGTLTQQARLCRNGNPVQLGAEVTGTPGVLRVTATLDLTAGDLLTVETMCTFGFQGAAGSITAGAGTYVLII
ncbi:hypothetical protein [Nocardia sp. NPDC052566]|uniref:hypothetical protein n=1 Tax=Nocardia sp. NPDC052566 TaxID=3364330 RepID=UPI0037C4FCFD